MSSSKSLTSSRLVESAKVDLEHPLMKMLREYEKKILLKTVENKVMAARVNVQMVLDFCLVRILFIS